MAFIDNLLGNADQTQALGLLGSYMMAGNTPGGFQAAMGLLSPENRLKREYMQAQLANLTSEAAVRQAQIDAAKRKQEALPSLFQTPAVPASQGQPGSGSFGVLPTNGQPDIPPTPAPTLNWRAALAAGYSPKDIQEMDALRNIGLNKVARTVKATGPDGREYEYQMDDFGRPVGAPMAQYRAPIQVNRGNSSDFLDAYTLEPKASFKTFQSPDSAASVAATIRGQNMTDARAREQIQLGKVPAGYRQKPDGTLEYIPGGPADPNAAKKAAPTEFQGKAAMFGARAQEADKIINDLAGQYSPAAINAKNGVANTPLVGGVLEPMANLAMSSNSQRVEQAQRDFVNAVLRLESGAAISQGEFENARKQYFPQPGDSQAVIAQKAANRQTAIRGLMSNARPGSFDAISPEGPAGASGSWSIQKVN